MRFDVDATPKEHQSWWIGVFNQGEDNLRKYLAYTYLRSSTDSLVEVTLPTKPGNYELVLATDDYDKEKADNRISISILGITSDQVSLEPSATSLLPGESFTVAFSSKVSLSSSAWIGLFAAEIEKGKNSGYASYQYVNDKATYDFTAPEKQGQYELRFMDADPGNQIVAIPFAVNDNPDKEQNIQKTESDNTKVDQLVSNIKAIADKGKSEREIRQEAWRIKAESFSSLSDADVNRLISAHPVMIEYFESINKDMTETEQDIMLDATLSGEIYNGFLVILEDKPEKKKANDIAIQQGYADYQEFANHTDRFGKIYAAIPWILSSRNMVFGDTPKPEPIDNLLAYIQDESNPEAERKKLTGQLYDLIGDYKTNKEDVELLTKHYDKLEPIYSLK